MTWQEEKGFLTKEFECNNFVEAITFVNTLVPLAEDMNHHPDILIHSYKKVKIMLRTHDKDTITEIDHALAHKIDSLHIR